MRITDFISVQALLLVPALYVLGILLKATPKFPDWVIPWALLAVSIAGAMLMLGLSPDSAVQGIMAAGAAVLVHQLFKQTARRE